MKLPFTKMHGAGNDFVLIDNRKHQVCLTSAQISKLCDRHYGIGADGLLLVELSKNRGDFRMRYYNSDGQEAEMCGNGARCFARYAQRISRSKQETFALETRSGIIQSTLLGKNVETQMSDPTDYVLRELQVTGTREVVHFLNIGVPHVVIFVESVGDIDISSRGAELRSQTSFTPSGTNVNFAQVLSDNHLRIRTYERGVEAETLACGTGAAACALSYHLQNQSVSSPIDVTVKGGDTLRVIFESSPKLHNVRVRGPASFVFDGEIDFCHFSSL